jgi:AcrR family transcriptional regulator
VEQRIQTKKNRSLYVGRPRKDGRPPIERTQILSAAAQLFAVEGYTGTSMRRICKELGVVPSSVFHQFKNKLAILEGIVVAGMKAELAYYEQLAVTRAPAAVQLYLIITTDVSLIAQFDTALKKVLGLPEARNPRFKKIYHLRLRSIDHFTALLRKGIKEGDFRDMNATVVGEMVVLLSELPAYTVGKLGEPRALAAELARFVFGGLLRDPRKLDAIKKAARELPRVPLGRDWPLI